jgi:hypothetical protein
MTIQGQPSFGGPSLGTFDPHLGAAIGIHRFREDPECLIFSQTYTQEVEVQTDCVPRMVADLWNRPSQSFARVRIGDV